MAKKGKDPMAGHKYRLYLFDMDDEMILAVGLAAKDRDNAEYEAEQTLHGLMDDGIGCDRFEIVEG